MHGRRVQTPHLMYFPRPLLPLHPMQRRIPPIMRTTSSCQSASRNYRRAEREETDPADFRLSHVVI